MTRGVLHGWLRQCARRESFTRYQLIEPQDYACAIRWSAGSSAEFQDDDDVLLRAFEAGRRTIDSELTRRITTTPGGFDVDLPCMEHLLVSLTSLHRYDYASPSCATSTCS